MDPTACLQRWVNAVLRGDIDEARYAHEDLENWLARGGFEPRWDDVFPGVRAHFESVKITKARSE